MAKIQGKMYDLSIFEQPIAYVGKNTKEKNTKQKH